MQAAALALVALVALAGCSQAPPTEAPKPKGSVVEGWVLDPTLRPVAGAVVRVEGGNETTADASGHYALRTEPGAGLLLIASADGHKSASRSLGSSGPRTLVNFTLERLPDERPFHQTTNFRGIVSCAVVAILVEDPERPHEHQSVRCSQLLPEPPGEADTWDYAIPAKAQGLILEADWTPANPLSTTLLVNVTIPATGQVIAFKEGYPPLKMQIGAALLADALANGGTLLAQAQLGAGTGNHDHGAFGATVEQSFHFYMTAFINGPADSSFSFVEGG